MLKLMKRPHLILSCRTFYVTPKNNCEDEPIERLSCVEEKIGFIGDGNMAKAIFKGIVNKCLIQPNQVNVSSPYIKNLDVWKEMGACVSTDNAEIMEISDVVFLAVKPHILPEAIKNIEKSPHAANIKNKLFLSILAGYKISKLEKMLSCFEGARVVRLMPNTPMMVGAGCTAFCPGHGVTEHDLMIVRAI
ncbi:PREDICTED: pyrroline-5-carboxylate reductase 3-like, partial [Nicrophorus vespilloides]